MAGRHSAHDDADDADDLTDLRVEVLADADRPGGLMLLLDRVRQSYVDIDDPRYLEFEYIRWMSHAIDNARPGPLAATHLGGGAGTLVRYISATRPGSTHIVCEPDEEVTALVRAKIPYPRGVRPRIRPVDARTGLRALNDDSADLVVLDAFAGGRVPADLTTGECLADIARVLRADGQLLINIGDGGPLAYTRRVVAGVLVNLPNAMLVTDKGVLHGRRYGNIVVMASASQLATDAINRGLTGEMFPCASLSGPELVDWPGGARPFTDSDSARSPSPPDASWRVTLD
jgi:hypothetical protein